MSTENSYESAQDLLLEEIKNKYKEVNWEDKCSFEYNTYFYKFNDDLDLDIISRIYKQKILTRVLLNQDEVVLSKSFQFDTDTFEEKIKEYINFIYNVKFNYNYSKIRDNLILKECFEKEEKLAMAKIFIKHDIIEDCSVCMEKNTVLTRCKHNLCRVCYSKMVKLNPHINCPLCRKCLCPHCNDEDEEAYEPHD
jgi:hypothetical protein